MDAQLARDLMLSTAIFGFFAFVWFGWAQEDPPPAARIPLAVGSGIGAVLATSFGILTAMNWDEPTAMDPSGTGFRNYLIIVAVEFVTAAAGGIALAFSRWKRFVPVWILLVVGLHFFALAPVLDMPALNILAGLLVAVVAATMAMGRFALGRCALQPSFVSGALAGLVLLVFAGIAAIAWATMT